MTVHRIRQTVKDIDCRQSLPQRLFSAYQGLELIEHSIRRLALLTPVPCPPVWKVAQRQAAQACGDLAHAPAFSWPSKASPPALALALADEQSVLVELVTLAEAVVLALVEASAQAVTVADHRACTVAAIRTCLLQQTLQLTAETPTGPDHPPPD